MNERTIRGVADAVNRRFALNVRAPGDLAEIAVELAFEAPLGALEREGYMCLWQPTIYLNISHGERVRLRQEIRYLDIDAVVRRRRVNPEPVQAALFGEEEARV